MGEGPGGLAAFVSQMGGDRQLRVEESLGAGFVRLRVAEAERRQAKHDIRCVEDVVVELLRNARDAGARHIYVATMREGDRRTLTMLDDGSGIPQELWERVFEARVTSKLDSVHMDRWGVHGRGMALYSVSENAEDARVVCSGPGLGTSLRVVTDTANLTERADQSTWPTLGQDDEGARSVRGPHNIARACCEFALEEQGRCEVYLGSPADMVATARHRAVSRTALGSLLNGMDALPLPERLAAAADASELAGIASALGLAISERTAHRIIGGQVRPQRSVLTRLVGKADRPATQGHEVDLMRDRRGLRLSEGDVAEFARMMGRDFSFLADRYYLSLASEPHVRVTGDRLSVTFDILRDD